MLCQDALINILSYAAPAMRWLFSVSSTIYGYSWKTKVDWFEVVMADLDLLSDIFFSVEAHSAHVEISDSTASGKCISNSSWWTPGERIGCSSFDIPGYGCWDAALQLQFRLWGKVLRGPIVVGVAQKLCSISGGALSPS